MPHSCPRTGAAAPCVEHSASKRVRAGQLTWCQVKDSSRYASSWRRTCQSRQAMIGTPLVITQARAPRLALLREPAPAPALPAVRFRFRVLSRVRLCPLVPPWSYRSFEEKLQRGADGSLQRFAPAKGAPPGLHLSCRSTDGVCRPLRLRGSGRFGTRSDGNESEENGPPAPARRGRRGLPRCSRGRRLWRDDEDGCQRRRRRGASRLGCPGLRLG